MGIVADAGAAGDAGRLTAATSISAMGVTPLGYRVVGSGALGTSATTLDRPAYGLVTSPMMVDDSDVADLAFLARPYCFGSLALFLGKDLPGFDASIEKALEAVELVFPAIDIAERPFVEQRMSRDDFVAANGFGGYVIVGDGGRAPSEIDLACCGVVLEADGEITSSGAGAAVLGHPALALVWLARTLGDVGDTLKAGALVLVGEITRPMPIAAERHVRVAVGGLGSASVRFR